MSMKELSREISITTASAGSDEAKSLSTDYADSTDEEAIRSESTCARL